MEIYCGRINDSELCKAMPGRRNQKDGMEKRSVKLGDVLLHLVWPMYKIGFIAIPGYLVNRVSAYRTLIQMIQYLKLLIEIQLFVEQLNQLFEAACIHDPSPFYRCHMFPANAAPLNSDVPELF
jgi:hypothetical protein